MSKADELFNKLEKMPLETLLRFCSLAVEERLEKKRLDVVLMLLETRLQKYRMMSQLGMKPE